MNMLPSRGLARLAVAGMALAAGATWLEARGAQGDVPAGATAPVVYEATVDSIIHPVSAEYMVRTIDDADAAGAALVVFTLRTPGGLVDSARDIVTRMLSAKTPVAVFVGPSGERAASAGFIITLAADVAAMAPGTHIGAAHPVQGGAEGQPADPTMAQKAAQDVAAWVRTLAQGRGRNVTLAEEAVNDSRAFTEREALDASPALIDLVAPDVPALVAALDGRTIRRFDGEAVTLHTTGARVVDVEMTWRQRVLGAIAHPNIAFMLLSLGTLGLIVELWSPGAIFPGLVGAFSLILAFFALQLLPVNYAGLLLVALGLLMLVLEIKVTSYGMLAVGGIVSLIVGAMMLIDAPEPELRVDLQVVLPVVLGFAAIALFLIRLAVNAQRQAPASGAESLVQADARTLTALAPGDTGQIRLKGEIWRAVSEEAIPAGVPVRVTRVDGLTLTVRKL
ncbi:MAG: nodulation protein NfeD [Vicinamibacterales bacterium]